MCGTLRIAWCKHSFSSVYTERRVVAFLDSQARLVSNLQTFIANFPLLVPLLKSPRTIILMGLERMRDTYTNVSGLAGGIVLYYIYMLEA